MHGLTSDVPALVSRLTFCISDLSKAYSSLRLQLNHLSLSLDSSTVPCSTVVRDLGVLLDSELTIKQHISKVTSICYYHLRRLRQIRNYVSREIMIQLVMSLVISCMDYCNSVLVGLPSSTLAPLQRVQNAAARLILGLSRRSHINPALQQLHWLPIKFRITSKVATLMYNIIHQRSPPYLKDLVAFSLVHISVSYSHPQPGPLSSVEQEHSSVDVHSQSAALTSGTVSPLTSDSLTHNDAH